MGENTNWRQQNRMMNPPQKRDYNSSRQNALPPNKMQRINQLQGSEIESDPNPNEGYEGDVCDEIPDDLISQSSETLYTSDEASTFLSA